VPGSRFPLRLLVVAALLDTSDSFARTAEVLRRVRAAKTTITPRIDGRLDDSCWRRAAPIAHFVQRAPAVGAAPTQKSEAWLLYDTSALYVGLRLHDTQPDQILTGLGRRDSPPPSDSVSIYLDPLRTGQRAYYFRVNVSGVLSDGLVYNQTVEDGSWDGAWSAEVSRDGGGWTAEFRIPLTSIAFQRRDVQSWGLYIERNLQRLRETSSWPAMPKWGNAFVAYFARLEGLRGLQRAKAVRLQPFVSTEFRLGRRADAFWPAGSFVPNGGFDLRYTSRGDLRVVASFNPDFAEVEEDPAVVVLTADEAFFNERRPFFLAGIGIFRTPAPSAYSSLFLQRQPPVLLYTRRMGRAPEVPDPRPGNELLEVDPQVRILGAMKLLGEAAGRLSYGAMSVLQMPSDALELAPSGQLLGRELTPWSHYGVLRSQLRIGVRSSVGAVLTGVTRFDDSVEDGAERRSDAYVGAVDFDLQSASGWQLAGLVSGASSESGGGYGAYIRAGQLGEQPWRYWLELESYSPDYDINDMGFLWRTNMVQLRGRVERLLGTPYGILQEWSASLLGVYAFAHDAPEISFERLLELGTYGMLINRWEFWAGVSTFFERLDDRETRGGPPLPREQTVGGWVGANTDAARSLVEELNVGLNVAQDALTWNVSSHTTVLLWRRLRSVLTLAYSGLRGFPFWVETIGRGAAEQVVIGDLDFDQLELGLTSTFGISRQLTLQLWGQLLYSVGRYPRYRQLVDRALGDPLLMDLDYSGSADFTRLAVIVNAIIRWDLGAGTAAFLVYKLDGALADTGTAASFSLGSDLRRLFGRRQTHRLLLKLSYAWDI
jgi:hypothetical protein